MQKFLLLEDNDFRIKEFRKRFKKDFLEAAKFKFIYVNPDDSPEAELYVYNDIDSWIKNWIALENYSSELGRALMRGLCLFWFLLIPFWLMCRVSTCVFTHVNIYLFDSVSPTGIKEYAKQLTKENLKNEN